MLVNETVQANLLEVLAEGTHSGALWATESEDLDCTFVLWKKGEGVRPHVNSEVDVVMIVMSGSGEVLINGEGVPLTQGQVVLVPKGAERSVQVTGEGLAYLNVHKRKRKLMPGNIADRPRSGSL